MMLQIPYRLILFVVRIKPLSNAVISPIISIAILVNFIYGRKVEDSDNAFTASSEYNLLM
jgi:hypothetical protein